MPSHAERSHRRHVIAPCRRFVATFSPLSVTAFSAAALSLAGRRRCFIDFVSPRPLHPPLAQLLPVSLRPAAALYYIHLLPASSLCAASSLHPGNCTNKLRQHAVNPLAQLQLPDDVLISAGLIFLKLLKHHFSEQLLKLSLAKHSVWPSQTHKIRCINTP